MSQEVLLFVMRLAGAAVLLVFLGTICWLLWKDLRGVAVAQDEEPLALGSLVVVESPDGSPALGQTFDLLPVTAIGRNGRNQIILDEAYVSSEHALVFLRHNRWWLQDLGSRNGTLLNEAQLLDDTVLSDGDVVTIGNVGLRITLDK